MFRPLNVAAVGGMSRALSQFEQLLVEHRAALLAQARKLCRNPADADDLIQETFVRALQQHGKFVPGSNARAWLGRLMTNLFIDRLRREAARPSRELQPRDEAIAVEEAEIKPPDPDPTREDLQAALERLDDDLRAVFVACCLEKRSYAEVSTRLGIKEGTIGSKLNRARKKLRELLLQLVRK